MAKPLTEILHGNPLELLLNEAMMGIMPFDDYYSSLKPDVMLTPVEDENFQIGVMYCIFEKNVYIKSINVQTNLNSTEKNGETIKKIFQEGIRKYGGHIARIAQITGNGGTKQQKLNIDKMAKINHQAFPTKKQQLRDLLYLREECPNKFGFYSISLGPFHKKYFTYDQEGTDDNPTQAQISIAVNGRGVWDLTGNIWNKEKKLNGLLSFMTEHFGYKTDLKDWKATYHQRGHFRDPIDLRPQKS
ncbi:hypothetical protein HON71_01540 [Candidatus Woesearchaeota archaeon]|jgi:hypothetical protein|nr:hypothetical protein [Candidatus Woesearchaeota archaeon]MBT5342765.1 hypothetical protein [Candidatus Woesearchaeota archaeon]